MPKVEIQHSSAITPYLYFLNNVNLNKINNNHTGTVGTRMHLASGRLQNLSEA